MYHFYIHIYTVTIILVLELVCFPAALASFALIEKIKNLLIRKKI